MNIEYELLKKIYRKKTLDKYIKKSNYLNDYNKNHVYSFLIFRLFLSIIIFFITFIVFDRNLLLSLILMFTYSYLHTYFKYDYKIIKRVKLIEKEASLFFEVMILSLKSGKNLQQSIESTIINVDNSFSKEFSKVLEETKYGKSLLETLNDYKDKVPSENIKNIFIAIIEAYTLGKDMIESIQKELDLLDEKRINDIKVYINKLPIKVSVISVFILIPLMLLLILSPVILEYFG